MEVSIMATFLKKIFIAFKSIASRPVYDFSKINSSNAYAYEWKPENSPSLKVKFSDIYKERYHNRDF